MVVITVMGITITIIEDIEMVTITIIIIDTTMEKDTMLTLDIMDTIKIKKNIEIEVLIENQKVEHKQTIEKDQMQIAEKKREPKPIQELMIIEHEVIQEK